MAILLLVIGTTARLLRRADRYITASTGHSRSSAGEALRAVLAAIVALTTILWGSWGMAQASLVQRVFGGRF